MRGALDEAMNFRGPALVNVVLSQGAARKPQQFRLAQLSGCGAFRRGIVTNRRFAVHPRCARFFGRSSDP